MLAAIVFEERGSEVFRKKIEKCSLIVSSSLLEAEIKSAMWREALPLDAVAPLLEAVTWVFPNRSLGPEIDRILALSYLRGADLYHLATALYLFPDPEKASFLSLDKAQHGAARTLGFSR